MRIRDLRKKMLAEDPKFRKAWHDLQWNTKIKTASEFEGLLLRGRLKQGQLAKKMGTKQSAISRAIRYGCSLEFLQRAAKSYGKVVKLHIENERPLNPTYSTDAESSQTVIFETSFAPLTYTI